VGLVLGSGLGPFAEEIAHARRVPYAQIPWLPSAAVEGHAGNLHLGILGQVPVACLQGRVHAYEGYPVSDVVFGVGLLSELGCRTVLLTNAAGGIDPAFAAGDLMLITDHLNLTGQNPLLGPVQEGHVRFPDMSQAYDAAVSAAAHRAAQRAGVELREGIYAGVLGPSYETPAEVRMLRTMGAGAVGMSTVLEVIALRQLGVRVGAVSCITNLAAGISDVALSHAEVQDTAAASRERFTGLLRHWVAELGTL
jgi:purine-nucleoside phosphorylase